MPDLGDRAQRGPSIKQATAGSLFAGLWSQATLMVSGVLVARALGPLNRGYFALLILWPVILTVIGGLGIPSALPYFLARNSLEARRMFRAIPPFMVVQVGCLLVFHSVVLWLFLHGRPSAVVAAGLISLATVPASLALEYVLSSLQGLERYTAFNAIRIIPTTFYTLGVLSLFLLGIKSLPLIVFCWTGSYLIAAAIGLAATWRFLVEGSSTDVSLSQLIRFGLKGLLGSISPLETFRLDQAVVGLWLSPLALGIYVVGLAFTNLPRFLAQSVGAIAYPYVATRAGTPGAAALVWRLFWLTLVGSALVVVLLMLGVGGLVRFFFGTAFSDATAVAQILLVGAIFLSARRVLADGARGLGLPELGTFAELGSWVWLLPALAVLMKSLGLIGVAWAFASAAIVSVFVAASFLLVRQNKGQMAGRGRRLRSGVVPCGLDGINTSYGAAEIEPSPSGNSL